MIKALHPAESTIKAERAPGTSRYPTTVQEIVSTFTVDAPSDLEDGKTWNLRVVTHSDPLVPVDIFAGDSSAGEAYVGSYLNQAFCPSGTAFGTHTIAELNTAMDRFDEACETYRFNALSTTGVFVGATMTDQGSIISSQFVDATRDMCYVDPATANGLYAMANLWIDPYPAVSEATLGQRPYVSDARSGWYAPQKFDAPGHWQKTNDRALRGRFFGSAAGMNPATIPLNSVTRHPIASDSSAAGVTYWVRCFDDSCSQTFVRNLAKTTSFRITVRLVLEMGVTPNNTYATFAGDPAPPDDLAYAIYSETVNQILDAYPADYNDLGKMWGKIKNVVSKVAKVIDPIAGVAAAVGVPYASVVQNVARGLGGKAKEYIAEGGGLIQDVVKARKEFAERQLKKKEAKAVAASKQQVSGSAKK